MQRIESVRELAFQAAPELCGLQPSGAGGRGLAGLPAILEQLGAQRTGEVLDAAVARGGEFDDAVWLPGLLREGIPGALDGRSLPMLGAACLGGAGLAWRGRQIAAVVQDDSGDVGSRMTVDQSALFRSLRRSRSERPPQIPKRSSLPSAYSRHSCFTLQAPQTFLASRVDPPFSGKKASGSV